jgi:hypothetical protein
MRSLIMALTRHDTDLRANAFFGDGLLSRFLNKLRKDGLCL